MSAALLGWAWTGLAVATALCLRPVPARPLPRAARVRASLSTRLGTAILRRVGRDDGDELLARRVGLAVLAVGALLPLRPLASAPAALVAWSLPGLQARGAARTRQGAIERSIPEVVDLLVLATGAGLGLRHAVAAVAARAEGPLGPMLQRAVDEAEQGRRLADALDDVPAHAGEATRAVVAALAASERYGSPVVPALERLAVEVRADSRRRAEAAARRVPVKLLFPLVLCILPAFGLLTVAPLIASALRSLRL